MKLLSLTKAPITPRTPGASRTKVLAVTSALLLSALTASSCLKEDNNNKITQDTVELTNLKNSELDLSKPNLPVITDDYIYYKNLDGDVIQLDRNKRGSAEHKSCGSSVYKAIQKMSTTDSPNIEDVGRFYSEVEKDNLNFSRGINILHATQKFKNLFDVYTHPDSKLGRTISVEEYTAMMDAWSSTVKIDE